MPSSRTGSQVEIRRSALNGSMIENIFDGDWYKTQLASRKIETPPDGDLLVHFYERGESALLSPHPLFDVDWYLSQNEDAQAALKRGIFPFEHFMTVGEQKGFWPHALFDVPWYREINGLGPDINVLVNFALAPPIENRSTHPHFDAGWYAHLHVNPQSWHRPSILHFVLHGQACGYKPNRWGNYDTATKLIRTDPRPYKLSRTPLVSLIIPNLDGAPFLVDLLPSLQRQTYDNFELIFVDNGSTDQSITMVVKAFPQAKVIHLKANAGYAEANNIGYKHARGELIALLNNDTVAGAEWLEMLVNKMRSDVNLGAVCPKIRFKGRFCQVVLQGKQPFILDKQALLDSLIYRKFFVAEGHAKAASIESASIDSHFIIKLHLPFQTEDITLEVRSDWPEYPVSVLTRNARSAFRFTPNSSMFCLRFTKYDYRHSFFVINNAGGCQPGWLQTADIGFGHPDCEEYSQTREVELLCGCAALIRRDALYGANLFFKEFVAYYEDSELSLRLRRSGFHISYCPEAVVYHHHSATTVEYSPFWLKQVHRNRILFSYLCSDLFERRKVLPAALHEMDNLYTKYPDNSPGQTEREFRALIPALRYEVADLCGKIANGEIAIIRRTRVGIFNLYWNTLGGGEAHAMLFACYLSQSFQVELISVDDFDIDFIGEYFDVDPSKLVKRLIKELTRSVTAEYDLFINSTFMNECPSDAKSSIYIVSFPSRAPSIEFLQSYTFFANSDYTRGWIDRYWGRNIEVTTLKPCISPKIFIAAAQPLQKERILLSVGRFFRSGHSKNQVVIADCFRNVCAFFEWARAWKLVFIGTVNDSDYLDEVRASLIGTNYEIITNASFEYLCYSYRRAAVYVHAAGFGNDPEIEPANFEHFGMTVAEAAASGCLPLVYDAAGPKEIVNMLEFGYLFSSRDELDSLMIEAMQAYNVGELHNCVKLRHEQLRKLSRERLIEQIETSLSPITAQFLASKPACWGDARGLCV